MTINKMFCSILVLFLSACASTKLSYQIDPEITGLDNFKNQSAIFAVNVDDQRNQAKPNFDNDRLFVSGPKNEVELLKNKFIDALKKQNFKIISNPLLADISLEFTIKQLDISIVDHFYKSNITGNSQLIFKVTKDQQTMEKLYKLTQSQEVANPVSNLDLTGVVNQLLSNQIKAILADPSLKEIVQN